MQSTIPREQKMKSTKTTTPPIRNLINRLSLRRGFLLLALACFALSSASQAVSPAPDGGYPNQNTAEGANALVSLTTGVNNTAIGFDALLSNTTGANNTAEGIGALLRLTSGRNNTANGAFALLGNTTGHNNTASGLQALFSNTTGNFNDAVGANALSSNTDGFSNNALGESALLLNIHGAENTAVGDLALENNDSTGNAIGNFNTAVGAAALFRNTDGDSNNAVGVNALQNNVDGSLNNAVGFNALGDNISGAGNTAIGDSAGTGNTSGDFNTYLGVLSTPVPDGESDTIRIGDPAFGVACFIGGIFGQNAAGGSPVFIDSNGQLGTLTSSARFKDEIKPMEKASESILALKPVTFRYKKEIDAKRIPQFGLVAEEVEKVNPDLVVRDAEGKVNTVRYEAVNAMLLNEFLKEHSKVQALEATVTKQQKEFESTIAKQQKQIEALSVGLQKVTARVELKKPAPQMVTGNQ
jgi:hypothetical protein